MRIGLSAFGDAEMGMGHIYRCLVLARMLTEHFPAAALDFAAAEGEPGVSVLRERFAGPVTVSPRDQPPQGQWDVLIVDRLSSDPAFLAGCRTQSRILVVLDDTGPGHWLADLAINGLYGVTAPRPDDSPTLSLAGFDYLILDPAFAAARPARAEATRLLLTQGGADTYGLTPPLAQALGSLPDVELHVHTGPAFRFDAELAAVTAPFQRHRRVPDMAEFLASMDMAVSAGGMLACELAALGLPLVLISDEPKEWETMAALAAQGAAIDLGAFGEDGAERARRAIAGLADSAETRYALSEAARKTVDGRGAHRIAEAIGHLLGGETER